LVFNPAIKERHFSNKRIGGQKDWILKTKEDIRAFWIAEYKNKVAVEPKATYTKPYEHKDFEFSMFDDYIYNQLAALDIQDEYDAYCTAPLLLKAPPNLIQYWDGQAEVLPSLSRMALNLLSIPAMTAECKRVFSSLKILISDRRNRLKDDIIEASECLNY
jgi:hypothetical protein